jgi:hypothetical protein
MSVLDETVAEVLGSVLTTASLRLGLALGSPRGRRRADVELARWFDTYALTDAVPQKISGELPPEELAEFLRDSATQSIVYELLAARLTAAPEAEVERLSRLFAVAGSQLLPSADSGMLFDFLDGQVCDLVGRLGGADPDLLQRVRQDAYLGRVVAAINRQTAALSGRFDPVGDREFTARYRRHAADQHGKLQPPDSERRRFVPIHDLYVPPVVTHLADAGPGMPLPETGIWGLADGLHRAVLLGDPGGGKTTAANVIMHRYAADPNRALPFMVTLREYAAEDPPERSVLDHIQHKLAAFYQCRPPEGLVESLLLSGSVLVIFDGLDELLDTSRRSEVAAIVEHFCAEYPLSRVLVTSRTVGYDQARLDDRQFECYQLSGFNSGQVSEYVGKWFAAQERIDPGEAAAFLAESASASDLRSSPLMLALMCILFRGEGSIPRSRPELYEKCAALLFHKWDASRKIHLELRARNFIEPALRHLAHWLLTRAEAQPVVTEQDLVVETAAYLHGRGFEELGEAQAAAREFVEFCRGRLWVFTEAGTTGRGEPLYTFTHRTFLEYFAAAYLASIHDSPEQLARQLLSRVVNGEWDTVAQLAVQIKDRAAERGGDRIFQVLLADRRYRSATAAGNVLGFLGRCTAFIEPAPVTLRELVARAFAHARPDTSDYRLLEPLGWLMASVQRDLRDSVAAELERDVAALVESGRDSEHILGLRLSLQLHNAPFAINNGAQAWTKWDLSERFGRELMLAAQRCDDIAAVMAGNPGYAAAILAGRADLPEFLFRMPAAHFLAIRCAAPAEAAFRISFTSPARPAGNPVLDYVENRLRQIPVPAISADLSFGYETLFRNIIDGSIPLTQNSPAVGADRYCALAYLLCAFAEVSGKQEQLTAAGLGVLGPLHAYLTRRWGLSCQELPELPVAGRWQAVFTQWACRETDFLAAGTNPQT